MDASATQTARAAAIAELPNPTLTAGSPVQDVFLGHGIASFRDACTWVQHLEYGDTTSGHTAAALLTEQRGTCSTKHGVIAMLAAEIGLPVHKHLGFYRMDDAMVPGVRGLLEPFGLPFVPMVHCFLRYGDVHVDLTEGNRDGRVRPIDGYDFVLVVAADSTRQDFDRLYLEHVPRYYEIEPRFAGVSVDRLAALAASATRLAHARAASIQISGTGSMSGCTSPTRSTSIANI